MILWLPVTSKGSANKLIKNDFGELANHVTICCDHRGCLSDMWRSRLKEAAQTAWLLIFVMKITRQAKKNVGLKQSWSDSNLD